MKEKNKVLGWETVKTRVTVNGENGSSSRFKITIDPFYVKIKSKPIKIENNSVEAISLEELLTALVIQSDWIKGVTWLYKVNLNSKNPSFHIVYGQTITSAEDYPDEKYGETPLTDFPEFHLTDMLQVGKFLLIGRRTFDAMLVAIYDKLENEKAPVDTDDDIEDHDNYFKAYSNTKFTDASLKKLLEMSGNDHSNED